MMQNPPTLLLFQSHSDVIIFTGFEMANLKFKGYLEYYNYRASNSMRNLVAMT